MNIIENYFVEVYFGYPMQKLKLVIEPTSPYSYILKKYDSKTKNYVEKSKTMTFSNAYGQFTGVWIKDKVYLTKDKNFNFEFKFLEINNTTSLLNVDGVLGLGYSLEFPDGSIYYYLKKMDAAFSDIKNVMTFDSRNSMITIGEIAKTEKTHNPIKLSLVSHEKYPGGYVDLKRIYVSHEELDLNDRTLLGLMPIIVAPKTRKEWLQDVYFPHLLVNNSQIDIVHDQTKLYSEIYATKFKDNESPVMQIEDYYFEYEYFRIRKNRFKSNIRFGDNWQNPMECWYIGLPTIYIDRADFDFDNREVTLFRQKDFHKSYFQFGTKILLFIIAVCFLIYAIVYILRIKPPKNPDKGTELQDF